MAAPHDKGMDRTGSKDQAVWLISESEPLCQRIAILLTGWQVPHRRVDPGALDSGSAWPQGSERMPDLVLLDVDHQVDRGARLMIEFRRRHPDIGMVILTSEFTRDFAEKILSQGVQYYLPQDFVEHEFQAAIESLWSKPATG